MQPYRQLMPTHSRNEGLHYVERFEGSNDMWLNRWDKKKKFMFKAFVSIDGPSSKLSEVLHTHAINLSLLRCAHQDIKCSLYIKQWMEDLRCECGLWV